MTTEYDEDLGYAQPSGAEPPPVPAGRPFPFPLSGPQPADSVRRFWALRLRPVRNECAHRRNGAPYELARFTSTDYHTCKIQPLESDEAMASHVILWANGVYDWLPEAPAPGSRSPSLEFSVSGPRATSEIQLIYEVSPSLPFTVVKTHTDYTITQSKRQWVITGIHPPGRIAPDPLTISFADAAWTVTLTDAERFDHF